MESLAIVYLFIIFFFLKLCLAPLFLSYEWTKGSSKQFDSLSMRYHWIENIDVCYRIRTGQILGRISALIERIARMRRTLDILCIFRRMCTLVIFHVSQNKSVVAKFLMRQFSYVMMTYAFIKQDSTAHLANPYIHSFMLSYKYFIWLNF